MSTMDDLEALEPAPPSAAPLDASPLPELAIAGPVSSEEEMLSVQQIALITRWMRFFTAMTKPQSPQA
ncbi:MAG: hypothetical protein LC624_02055 [Halobacteriales archaeon]|nr:hypothetical protein [Halobacteriales archaeon]